MYVYSKPRTWWRWTTVVLILAITGVAVTMPESIEQTLPGQISQEGESPAVVRIGRVVEIVEADNITVAISDSPTLVRASYLFPTYSPLLGDLVYVTKQDAQWFVYGTMAGPINSAVQNPSFEDGVIGSIPTGWSINIISSAGGVPTFTQVSAGHQTLAGVREADFGVDSTTAGNSIADVFSSTTPATPDSAWTAAWYITQAFVDNDAFTFSNLGGFAFVDGYIQFLDASSVLISETLMNSTSLSVDFASRLYRRPSVGNSRIVAPAGTDSVRLRFRGDFTMHDNAFTSFFMDYVVLRQVD